MGADTTLNRRCDEAAREIDATRRRMSEKADRLQDRLQPKALLRPVTRRLQETLGEGGEKILDAFRENPLPLALAGLGIGWMMLRDVRGERGRRPGTEEARETAAEVAGAVREKAAGAVQAVREKAAAMPRKVRENVRKASDWFEATRDENPMLLAAGALAVGIVAGLSLPVSAKEEEIGAKAAEKILEKGAEALEKGETAPAAVPAVPAAPEQDEALPPEL
jgi:hypothetical protein